MKTDKIGLLMLFRPIGYGTGSVIIGAIADKEVSTLLMLFTIYGCIVKLLSH